MTLRKTFTVYLSIIKHAPLQGHFYEKLPDKSFISKNMLRNIHPKNNNYFSWFYVNYLNSVTKRPNRITKSSKRFSKKLSYENVNCLIFLQYHDVIKD